MATARVRDALARARPVPYWLDQPGAPLSQPDDDREQPPAADGHAERPGPGLRLGRVVVP
ncbi:MAG: hypothetical protein ACLPN6_02135 [Streptosporangiaceae bacterium]|nr:hypothetical protein [Actinomycetota bacterium]